MAASAGKPAESVRLGDASFKRGDYDDAIASYTRAIKACNKGSKGSAARLALADAYNGMGHALRSKGQFGRSYEFQRRALDIYAGISRKRAIDGRMATALHYTADVLADLNRIDEALRLSRKELSIARRLYSRSGRNLEYLLYALNNTACRLINKNRFGSAIMLLNESIREQNRALGKHPERSYPNLSWTYHILGVALLNKGDTDGAIANLRKSLEMRLVIADRNKRFIGALMNTLANLSIAYSGKNSTHARSERGYV